MVPGLTPSQQCVFFPLLNIRFSSSHFSNLLRSLSAIWCINHFSKLYIICKIADSVHYHITHVINKDVKQNFPWWNCDYELVNGDWLFCTLFRTSAEINFFWRVLYRYLHVILKEFLVSGSVKVLLWQIKPQNFTSVAGLDVNIPAIMNTPVTPVFLIEIFPLLSNLVHHFLISLFVILSLPCHSQFEVLPIRLVSFLANMLLYPLIRWIP